MARKLNKISSRWICETRVDLRNSMDDTDFPDPERFALTYCDNMA